MQIKVSMIRNGKHDIRWEDLAKRRVRERKDVRQQIKLLLLQQGLTLEAIIQKYKDILDQKDCAPKGSDIVRILENLLKMHGLQIKQGKDHTT